VTVGKVATKHGLAPIAASTHPFAQWGVQKHTDKERYNVLARDFQVLARRLFMCGLHVHVGIDDDGIRIDLMNQVAYFLAHRLALSTSSPFWRGEDTRLMSYRLTVFDGLPRAGLPDYFTSFGEYQCFVDQLAGAGLIDDATNLRWDVRLSARFPTLEMRITDVCTRLDDSVTIAALYLCILSMLCRLHTVNQRWRICPRGLVRENRWLAQRYGTDGELVDFGKGQRVPYEELVNEIIALVREDAERFDCVREIEHARDIVTRGTSAHRQQGTFSTALEAGKDRATGLKEVVDMLIDETTHGL